MPTLDVELLSLQKALEKKSAAVRFTNTKFMFIIMCKQEVYATFAGRSRVIPVPGSGTPDQQAPVA